jgi:hypothetical protein
MLKDKLLNLQESGSSKQCKFATVCISLDDETRLALLSAMLAPGVSARAISNTLSEEGINIGATTILEARGCVKKTNAKCGKCLPELR